MNPLIHRVWIAMGLIIWGVILTRLPPELSLLYLALTIMISVSLHYI